MAVWLLYTWIFVIVSHTITPFTIADETTLRRNRSVGYESTVRPSSTVNVEIALQMTSVNSLDLRAQTLSISGWWAMIWKDSRLVWKPSNYGDIKVFTCYEYEIWTPSLVVSNSLTDLSAINEDTIPMRVTPDGTVTWNPPSILIIHCNVDTTFFPFDKQQCSVEVTSFGYSLAEVNLTAGGLLLDYYKTNGDWDLVMASSSRTEYEASRIQYGKISFNVTLRRRSDFYLQNVLLPIILNGILTIFLFILPPESGEKIGYALTVLLTYVVIMTLLAENISTSAKHTSLLEVYICIILCMSGLSVILAIINLALYHMDERHPVPQWASNVSRTCEIALCRSGRVGILVDITAKSSKELATYDKLNLQEPNHIGKQRNPSDQATQESTNLSTELNDEFTWKQMAAVLDAVFFRVYAISVPLITIVLLLVLSHGDS